MSEEIAAPERRTYQTPSQHPLLALFHFYGINPHEQDRVRPNDQNYFIPIKLALGCPMNNYSTLFKDGRVQYGDQILQLDPFTSNSTYPANIADRLFLRFGNWGHEPTRRRLCDELLIPPELITHFDRNLLPMITIPQRIDVPNQTDQQRQEIMRAVFKKANPNLFLRWFRGKKRGIIKYNDLPAIGSPQFRTGQLTAMQCVESIANYYKVTSLPKESGFYNPIDPICQDCPLASLCPQALDRTSYILHDYYNMVRDVEISYRGSIMHNLSALVPHNFTTF